jgi:hypothetical protein
VFVAFRSHSIFLLEGEMMIRQHELEGCYFIYHAPKVKKVGLTKRLNKRLRDQKLQLGKNGTEILCTVSIKLCPKAAGDIEFLLAKSFGYQTGTHYYEDR